MISPLRAWSGRQAVKPEWNRTADRVLSLESELAKLDDHALRKASLALRYAVLSGEPPSDLVARGFALVRESAARHLGMRHYPVQIIGGLAMHNNCIAVMQTGEGKTLAATLPLYLAALDGHGAHLATANDYLAVRDAELTRPIFQALGMQVGVVEQATPPDQRRSAYAADITYSTGKEIGFDFLRDRLARRHALEQGGGFAGRSLNSARADETVQRELNFMLVDEADSILIDEARTPLVISSLPDDAGERRALFRWAAECAARFVEEHHFRFNEDHRSIELSPNGRTLARKIPRPDLLARTALVDIYNQVELALLVERHFIRDRHYVVRAGQIAIVDEFTGRIAEGRKWRAGLHQAIEARESLEITDETAEAARITVQNLFGRYRRLCGMTGTVASSSGELAGIYKTRVAAIPTNRPPRREQMDDRVFATESEKWQAIVDEALEFSASGRPVLVGTRSIDKSELLSALLTAAGRDHQVLNARHLAREAEIVAQSGRPGRITVATNMAGRGTDIRLSDTALQAGGLHVIVSELHESARIDRQLVGRCGRQGDAGSFRFFMSLEDDILRTGLSAALLARIHSMQERAPRAELTRLAGRFRNAQRRIEAAHYRGRRMLLRQEETRQIDQRELGQDPYVDTIS